MNEILNQLKTILSTSLTSRGITTFFIGEIKIPAISKLPICTVYPIETRQEHSGTVRDMVEYDIAITTYINIRDYFDPTGQEDKLDTLDELVKIVEERETDGDLKTNTIMGIINANININSKVLYTNNMRATYDTYYDAKGNPIAGVTVLFTAFDRPNRN